MSNTALDYEREFQASLNIHPCRACHKATHERDLTAGICRDCEVIEIRMDRLLAWQNALEKLALDVEITKANAKDYSTAYWSAHGQLRYYTGQLEMIEKVRGV